MMICCKAKNWALWSKCLDRGSCHKLFHVRCLSAKDSGIPSVKSRQPQWRQQAHLFSSFQQVHTCYSRNPLIRTCVSGPYQSRTVVLSAALSAASTSNPNSGYGVYESLADSAPVHLAESLLTGLQEVTGLPWWANIICTTVALRTAVTLPLSVYQMYIMSKVENLQPEIEQLTKRLRYEVSVYGKQHGWNDRVAKFYFTKNLKRIISELYVRDNCHPFKASLLIWIQIPMWIFVSIALRNISFATPASSVGDAVQKQLAEGGALWFPDLTLPDSTWIIPISLGIINLVIVEMFALRKIKLSKFQKILTNFIRGISIFMIPIAASVPSSMALYWLSSSCVGLTHNLLLRSPALRRMCRIPRTKSDSDTPYKDLLSTFILKYIPKK
ncbi:cytochrome c oxidase assembly protein COX18, mitochondrial [Spea bombifrons]|uniref:cytochrome c oxidase assembly protein COX18, mitochondrial n=1 Tax=Spea bombifrons TaxID=233779 RepID=UPI00234958A5|nr:cytochrome c oxidase assembly protein COX18, mitochondrial [Spea bombifrons]